MSGGESGDIVRDHGADPGHGGDYGGFSVKNREGQSYEPGMGLDKSGPGEYSSLWPGLMPGKRRLQV